MTLLSLLSLLDLRYYSVHMALWPITQNPSRTPTPEVAGFMIRAY